jgi:hypothetical protein
VLIHLKDIAEAKIHAARVNVTEELWLAALDLHFAGSDGCLDIAV